MGNSSSGTGSDSLLPRGPCDCLISRKVSPANIENADVIIVDNGRIRTDTPTANGRPHSRNPLIVSANGHLPIAPSAFVNNASVGSNIFEKFTKNNCPMCLLLIGLDDAGKTSFLRTLMNRYPNKTSKQHRHSINQSRTTMDVEDPKPTLGFSKENIVYRKHDIVVHDLGGRSTIRGIWKNYFAEAHGIIIVLDSSIHVASPKWDELNDVLVSLTESNLVGLNGKPTVILLNKQDLKPNISEAELQARVDLKEFLDKYTLPFKVFPVCTREKELIRSAQIKRQVCYKNIEEALLWIVRRIEDSYPSLHMKVQLDSRSQIEREEQDRQERAAKFKAAREAAEKEAEENGEILQEDGELQESFVPIGEHLERLKKTEHVASDKVKNDNSKNTTKITVTPLDHNHVVNNNGHIAAGVVPAPPTSLQLIPSPLLPPEIRTTSALSIASKSEPNLFKLTDDDVSDTVIDDAMDDGDFRRQQPTTAEPERWSSVLNLKALNPQQTSTNTNGDIIISDNDENTDVQPSKLKVSRPPIYKRLKAGTMRRFSLQT